MNCDFSDKAVDIRVGENLNLDALNIFLSQNLKDFSGNVLLKQFPGGYSNLTYLLRNNDKEYVLRRPPFGADIKGAHDMGREFNVLSLLYPHYSKCPEPLLFCNDVDVIGAPFYIMQRVKGVILRNKIPEGMDANPGFMRKLSTAFIENLASLHNIDVQGSGLIDIGKPHGYVERQVNGWIKRYFRAETDKIAQMDLLTEWMLVNMPADNKPAMIHNDYKYDNIVLNSDSPSQIKAVLDWEMATVGDPLMDLGTTLAYWVAMDEDDILKPFNLSWLPGNLNRNELVDVYLSRSNLKVNPSGLLFYYVFGLFKVAVIAQQIYARFKLGHTKDKRFAAMIYLVKTAAKNAVKTLESGKI
jgi:aminoglycoside phosphotransferase (APT) family kinase protein